MEECMELEIDERFGPILNENECQELRPVLETFMKSYAQHKDSMTVEEWLPMEMAKNLPEADREEIDRMSGEILSAINETEEKKKSLECAIAQGRSKESWFAEEAQKAVSAMGAQEAAQYLQQLDHAVTQANDELYRTIMTQAGNVSRNPSLDGFIAEQYHAQTFNMNAEAAGSPYRAKVLEPSGSGYAKNSVDVVIVDGNGKTVRRYQLKYCKDADATAAAFERGDYRGQRKLVPEGQEADIAGAANVIEAPDGVCSNPLSKEYAKQMQEEAQSGKWNELNWNEYQTKDLAVGIGKQAGYAAVQGAVIGAGLHIAGKLCSGEPIEGEEVIETALVTGSDIGIKAAAGGALKVGVEKDIIKVIPKGTPAGVLANIAVVAVENVKVLGKIGTGEYTLREGLEKMQETTVATAAGLVAGAKGTAVGAAAGAAVGVAAGQAVGVVAGKAAGAALGTVLGPVGMAVGSFVGGAVAYMAGSKVGETVVKGARKLVKKAKDVVKTVAGGVKSVVSGVVNVGKSILGGVASFVGGLFGW